MSDLEDRKPLPRLLLIIPRSMPSATIYIVKPLIELARQNRINFGVTLETQVTRAGLLAADIVLFCRNIDPDCGWILDDCLQRGVPTVYDLDDNFWEVPKELKYAAHHHEPKRIAQLERYLRSVSRVRVYSRSLTERVREFNQQVDYVTPCIDMNLVQSAVPKNKDGKVRITYVTGRGAGDSLISLFADDLDRMHETYPDRLEVTWWGEVPERFNKYPSSRMVNIIHDYDQFIRTLASEGFDIGLAPLTPTSFNLSKTNTKFRDYGACRIAGVYSDVPVYNDVEHEKTGLLVQNQPGAWFDAMQRLVQDVPLRNRIREQAFRFVEEHYSQHLVEEQWMQLVEEMQADQRYSLWVGHDTDHSQTAQQLLSKIEQIKDALFDAYAAAQKAEDRAIRLEERTAYLNEQVILRDTEIGKLQGQVIEQQTELNRLREMSVFLAHQLDAHRSRRLNQWIERVFTRPDYTHAIYPSYHPLRDDSLIFSGSLKGFRLSPSISLHRVPYLNYRIKLNRPNLKSVSVALLFDLFPWQGRIGVEIVGAGGVLAKADLLVNEIQAEKPIVFEFDPISSGVEPLELRVYGQELDVPVRIFEWQRIGLLGLGHMETRPFVGLRFQHEGS